MACGENSGLTSGSQQNFEELEYGNAVSNNEHKTKNHDFDKFPKKIHEGKQGKHIPGHNNYQEGKSILTVSMEEAQDMVNKNSGYGSKVSENKERVDFGKTIGIFVDQNTGKRIPTTVGIIHYSKSGTHIVPAEPNK